MAGAKEVVDELRVPTREPRRAAPDAWAGFCQMHDAATANGVLSRRIKELTGLVIAVVKQCDGRIVFRPKVTALHGATPVEVAEAPSVTLLMEGGTTTLYRPRPWPVYREFSAPKPE